MTKGMFDDLFGENGQNLTEAQKREQDRKKTIEEYEYVENGVAYKPYDRLIQLSSGERTGGKLDQMLVEANRLNQAGYSKVYEQFGLTKDYEKAVKWGTSFLVGTGKVLQPFAAPQQVFFGNVGGLTDLVQGDVKGGMEKWKRGMNAALGFVTWGAVNGVQRDKAIYGKELANDWGIKGTAGAITGGLMDFFADPLLLAGVVGKAGSLARLGKLGDVLTPASRVAAMGDAEAILGGVSKANKPVADIFQRVTSLVDVVDNVSTGAIKNPAAFRRAAGEILRNPLQTSRSIPGLFSADAKYAGTPWETIRQNLDAAGAVEGAISFVNAAMRIPYSKAPLKQAWQAIPLSARMAMGQAVGTAVEGARFVPLGLGKATASGLSIAEQLISRWGTIPGIPEVNIGKLKETGRSYGAGVSRFLQESFRQRQIEAANMALRASDLTSRYTKITRKMDEETKRAFDHFSTRVLDAKDPAQLIAAWRDFETFGNMHGVTEIGADFMRRATDYDVYGATVRARLGLESTSGVHSYEAGRDLLNMIVRGEMDKAQDIVNQWQEFMVNPAFQNVMVRGYTDVTDATGKVIGQRPKYNPVIGSNSPATPLGQKVQRTLLENKVAPVAPVAALPTDQFSPIFNQAVTHPVNIPGGQITTIMDEPKIVPPGGFRTSKGSIYEYDPKTGMARRYKVPHQGHSATDVGWKDPMNIMFVEDEKAAQDFAFRATAQGGDMKFIVDPDQGYAMLVSTNPAGGYGVDGRIKISKEPKIGYSPFEFSDLRDRTFDMRTRNGAIKQMDFKSPKVIHVGNPISEMGDVSPLMDWEKSIMDLPLSARIPGRTDASIFTQDAAALSSTKLPENLKSTMNFMDEVVPVTEERMNVTDAQAGKYDSDEAVRLTEVYSDESKWAPVTSGDELRALYPDDINWNQVIDGYDGTAIRKGDLDTEGFSLGNWRGLKYDQQVILLADQLRRMGAAPTKTGFAAAVQALSKKFEVTNMLSGKGMADYSKILDDVTARLKGDAVAPLRPMPTQDDLMEIVAQADIFQEMSGLADPKGIIDAVRRLMGDMNQAQFDDAADFLRSQVQDYKDRGGINRSRASQRAGLEHALKAVRKEIKTDAPGISAPSGLASKFPKNMARYKALDANDEANLRRVQSILYMDEMKIRDADMGGADVPADMVDGLSPFRATYVEDGVTYVRPEPPQLIRGDDGGIYVRTGDDVVMKVVADKDGGLYAYGSNVANSAGKRRKAIPLSETERPLDPGVQPNVGSGQSYITFGALRNDPQALMEGMQAGALTDDVLQGEQAAAWLAQKSGQDFDAAAGLQNSWEARVNSIFDSKLISEIKPVNWIPEKVDAYDRASKGFKRPGNNPELFKKPDGTIDMEVVNRLREENPGWDLFTPIKKDSEYDDLLMFHGGMPPHDNLFAGNPRDYAKNTGLGGKGIYLTDWDGMAGTYGRGSTMQGRIGNIFAVRLGKGQRLLDMDAMPRDPHYIVRRAYSYLMDGADKELTAALKAERNLILKTITEDPENINGFDLVDMIRYGRTPGKDGMSLNNFFEPDKRISLDARANAWHDALIDRGYTGMRHIGGMRMGRKNADGIFEDLHNVVILLGNGREFAKKAIVNRRQLAMYDAQTGEMVARSNPLGDTMGDPKRGMAVKSSRGDVTDTEGLTIRVATSKGKPKPLERLTPEEAKTATMEINLSSSHLDTYGPAAMAKRIVATLAEARGKGIESVHLDARVMPEGAQGQAWLPAQETLDDLLSRLPGVNATEVHRASGIGGSEEVSYRLDLSDGVFADPDAVFGPHGYRKEFGTVDDLTDGLSSTKADYGRQVTTAKNPFAPIWADRDPNAWNWDERLGAQNHLRRMFMASENPEQVLRNIDRQREAAVAFDTDRLEKSLLKVLVRNNRNDISAREFAEQFQKAWSDPAVAPIDYLTQFFKDNGLSGASLKEMLKEVSNDIWKLGIDYRPPGKELARQMSEYLSGTSMSGPASGPLQNATSRAAEKSRADLAPHWQEALMQIEDIGEAIAKNFEVMDKVMTRRGMVQDMYNFLKAEGGLIPKGEWVNQLHTRQGWFTITADLHAQMKGIRAHGAGPMDDLPFQVDDMIPAAYGQALFAAVTTAKPELAQASLQYLNARWKQMKLANPATIMRDIGSNYAIAEAMGINPARLTYGLGQMARLYFGARKAGRGQIDLVDDLAHITLRNGQKISLRDMANAGDFLHSSVLSNEVAEPISRLAKELSNPAGNAFQRTVGAFQTFARDVAKVRDGGGIKGAALQVADAGAQLLGVPGRVVNKLGDFKGMVDMFHKGAVFILKLEEGLSPTKAARFADEVFFNYQNVPYTVDFLRRNAISPFAAWQFLSAGRLIKTMYENPYALQRVYRIPGSIRQGVGEQEYDDEARARSQYMRNSVWLPALDRDKDGNLTLRRDKEGRSYWANIGGMLPEQSTADMFLNGPGGLFSSAASPTIELLASLVSGKGYKGIGLYPGNKGLDEALKMGGPIADETKEAALRTMWQFGMMPWAPGQPMMQRLADSIEYTRQDYIVHPGAERFMAMVEDYMRDGPVVEGAQLLNDKPELHRNLTTPFRQSPAELQVALAGMFTGISASMVQPDPSKPGTMRGNRMGIGSAVRDLENEARKAVMDAAPEDRDMVRDMYKKLINKKRLENDVLNIAPRRERQQAQPGEFDF